MNYIFSFIIILSLIVSFFTGSQEQTLQAAFDGAKSSVEVLLSFAGIMCMWSGFIKIAERGGATRVLARFLSPVLKVLFPKLKKDNKALEYIGANMSANLLGVGNAATPAGIAAMNELDKINKNPEYASDEMSIFTVMNTASLQLLPTTVIALRSAFGSANPQSIVVPVWIASLISVVCAVSMMKVILYVKNRKKNCNINVSTNYDIR